MRSWSRVRCLVALAFVRIVRFHRLMKEIDPAPEAWQARTAELAERLGFPRLLVFASCRVGCRPCSGQLAAGPGYSFHRSYGRQTSLEQRTSLLCTSLRI